MNEEIIRELAIEMRNYIDLRIAAISSGPPGERGEPGERGIDGRDGRDGRDGTNSDVTQAQLAAAVAAAVEQATENMMKSIKIEGRQLMMRGKVIHVLPIPEYRGVFRADLEYVRGDMVSYGGSLWHCNSTAVEKPGEGSPDWQLCAKRGRDGRDR